MEQHNLIQGTPEWAAHRSTHLNASDAPAMLGCSPYQTRSQLLQALHTGIRPEVDDATQRRFDDGHRTEELARPIAEAIIGEELYPVVGTEGELSASFDGLTMLEDTNWECKRLNADLRTALPQPGPDGNDAANLPKHYRVQMEQQCIVAGCQRVLFTAAQFDDAGQLVDARHCWYYPDPALRAEILAGWKQFAADLATFKPAEAAPVVVAQAVQALPAVTVQVAGELVVKDNFRAFETALRDFLEHRLIREPKTDQDFADLDVQIKAMKGAEAALESAEAQMLAQVQTIDQAKKTKDMLHKLVRDNRLMAEKLLASEKERRRGEIVAGGIAALREHIDALNTSLGKPYMPQVPADFGGAVKGLKSLASMEDKVATELARAKIAASEIANRIQANLNHLREHAGEFKHLFPDTAAIVLKAPDDLVSLVTARIAEHKAAEEQRLERERARIRAEEAEKLQREQRAREENEAAAAAAAALAESRKAEALPPQLQTALEETAASLTAGMAIARASVVPMPTRAPVSTVNTTPTLRLGVINERLAPIALTADGLAKLGFPAAGKDRSAVLYHEGDFPRICDSLVAHIRMAAQQQQEAA
jgi:putative phage-type endonuclease